MDELAKINRIVTQQAEGCSREILLVLDATTGQNAVNQARLFSEVADITGIVLTKLDGTAKGGIVISIKNELDIPVKLIGLGEKIDDLQDFSSADFVNALFGDEVLDGTVNLSEPEETEELSEESVAEEEVEEQAEEPVAEEETEESPEEPAAEEEAEKPEEEPASEEETEESSEDTETEEPVKKKSFFDIFRRKKKKDKE